MTTTSTTATATTGDVVKYDGALDYRVGIITAASVVPFGNYTQFTILWADGKESFVSASTLAGPCWTAA